MDQPPPDDDFTPLRLVLQPTGAVIEIGRPDVVVGRHSGADVRLALPDVSRRHCRLFHNEGQWEVVNLNSLNGVWVNGEAVERTVLRHSDTLRLGGFTFMVDLSKPISGEDDPRRGVLRSIFSALPPADEEGEEPRRKAS